MASRSVRVHVINPWHRSIDLLYGSGDMEDAMNETPKEKLSALRAKIDQQRNTIAALKREGHEYTDAERQLTQMLTELKQTELRSD